MSQFSNTPITQLLPPTSLDAVERPINHAHGMPNSTYTDSQLYRFERDHVFSANWTALAFCDDHRDPETVTPVDFMGLPLLIVCDKNSEITVFHNVCSHRGRRLVREPSKTNGLIICPYHAWSYNLGGALKATPHIGGVGKHQAAHFAREKHGLKQINSHCWMGILFMNLNGEAAEFEQYVAPLTERHNQYIGPEGAAMLNCSKTDGGLSFDAQCNWKLAVENYCEAYHLPWVHPSLNRYSPLEQHYCMTISDNFTGQCTNTFDPTFVGITDLPCFPEWAEEKHKIAEYPVFYPNLLLGVQANHFYAMIIHPLAVDRTHEQAKFFYIGEGASADKYLPARESNLNAWQQVFSEDIGAIEEMQIGRNSTGFCGGVFSEAMDEATHHFHRWVARQYRQAYP